MKFLKFIDWMLLILVVASGIWAVALVIDMTDGGMSFLGFISLIFGVLLGSIFWFLLLIIRWILQFKIQPKLKMSPRSITAIILTPFVLFFPLIVSFSPVETLLIGLRFKMSQASLLNYVKQAQLGKISQGEHPPKRVGFFWVYRTEVEQDIVWLITSECGLDECGFVYSPQQIPPRKGEDSYVRFLNGWWRWHQSW